MKKFEKIQISRAKSRPLLSSGSPTQKIPKGLRFPLSPTHQNTNRTTESDVIDFPTHAHCARNPLTKTKLHTKEKKIWKSVQFAPNGFAVGKFDFNSRGLTIEDKMSEIELQLNDGLAVVDDEPFDWDPGENPEEDTGEGTSESRASDKEVEPDDGNVCTRIQLLEEEQESLLSSLMALTTHFAQVSVGGSLKFPILTFVCSSRCNSGCTRSWRRPSRSATRCSRSWRTLRTVASPARSSTTPTRL